MKKFTVQKKNIYLFVICFVIAVVSIAILSAEIGKGRNKLETQVVNEGWTAVAHGKTYNNVALDTDRFDTFNTGDVFVLTNTLPESSIKDPTLEIYSVHSTVDVYIDDEHIYNYGQEYYDKGKMLGYGWNFIRLPDNFAGKEVRIVFKITEDKSFEGMPAIYIVNGDDAIKDILVNERIYLAIGMFLIVIGAMGMFFAVILSFTNFAALKMFCIMLFSFLIGVYTLANSDLLGLFNLDIAQKCLFEYLSLYTFTIPFTVYFSDWITEKGFPRKLMLFYNMWVLAEFFFVALICLLHFTNVAHMPEFVTSSHVCMLVTLILIVTLTITRIKVNHKMDKGLAIGFALALGVAAVELVRYNISKFFTGFKDNKYSSSIGIAALIVVVTLFIDFMSKIAGNLRKEAEARVLEKMAYMDELTGVLNRRGIEEPMTALKSSKGLYSIISIDMNLLKMMNDTYGHATGDRALSLLAKKLSESFPEPCSIARVGGDEFVVTIPNTTRDWVEKHRDMFEEKLREYNMRGENVTLSAACGIAYSDEAEAPEKVFGIADDRMYRSKKESKIGRE